MRSAWPASDGLKDTGWVTNHRRGIAVQRVNIHHAKKHLSRLVERAAACEAFMIAKAVKPMVKVVPIEPQDAPKLPWLSFLEGPFTVPDDCDIMCQVEIEEMFYGKE